MPMQTRPTCDTPTAVDAQGRTGRKRPRKACGVANAHHGHDGGLFRCEQAAVRNALARFQPPHLDDRRAHAHGPFQAQRRAFVFPGCARKGIAAVQGDAGRHTS